MSGYAELLCRSNFSFLRGASHPNELVERAASIGHKAIGIADDASLAGIVRAHEAAKAQGIKLLVGARIKPTDSCELALYASDRAAYGRLCRLITRGRRRAPKGECHLTVIDVADHAVGLIALVIPDKNDECGASLDQYREIFTDRCSLAVMRHLGDNDARDLARQFVLAQRYSIPPVATNDVHYHVRERQPLQDVLTCIRESCTIHEAGFRLFANAERYLKVESRMRALFAGYEHAVDRTLEVADRCHFSLDELRYEYPDEICPRGMTLAQHIRALTFEGAEQRYPDGVPESVRSLLDKELALIAELRYEPYFLTVHDIVRFARSRGILCQGRGSAANSAVCFCLGITSVDPVHHEMLFERFISKERAEPPDIDVDFEHERREEVIQYIYEKYGRERAGLTATVISYRRKSALREVGKAMGLSLDQVDALSKNVDSLSDPKILKERLRDAGLDGKDQTVKLVLHLARELRGFPRHLSQHVGGFVITRGRLDELVPIENAAKDARTVIEWDKNDIDALGILKVDCLALGMLTAIRKCFDLIEKHHGKRYDLATVLAGDQRDPDNNPAPIARGVYDMICDGDTVGTFQIESRAQMQMLPRLKPRCFYDLVIEVAIIRPGPIQGGMVHPYLRRRDGVEAIEYPHPCTEPVLRRTLGVPLFQEQAMQLAVVAAGYTPGEADQLRKAMAAWKRNGSLDKHREKLLAGMAAKGIAPDFADKLYKQLLGFCDYGFPESHSASFALLVYVSCYLKRYYPAAYLAAMLNSQPLGFYSPASLVRDARDHGVEVLPADVNQSSWDITLSDVADNVAEVDKATWGKGGPTVRLGFRQIKGLGADTGIRIVVAREHGLFVTVEDFARRTGIYGRQLSILADADAFQSLGFSRRDALWQAKSVTKLPPLFEQAILREPPVLLPVMGEMEQVTHDYRTMGLTLRAHPMALIREDLAAMGISCNSDLATAPNGAIIEIAGIVLCRQRPATAEGVTFMTIEDETGVGNVIIWQNVFERHRKVVCGARLVRVYGEVQRDSSSGKVVNVVARRMDALSIIQAADYMHSRDFQ